MQPAVKLWVLHSRRQKRIGGVPGDTDITEAGQLGITVALGMDSLVGIPVNNNRLRYRAGKRGYWRAPPPLKTGP